MTIQNIAPQNGDVMLNGTAAINVDDVSILNIVMAYGRSIEVYAAGNTTLSGNKLTKSGGKSAPIIFYEVPDYVNGVWWQNYSEASIGAANNGANVRFSANDITSFNVIYEMGLGVCPCYIDNINHEVYFRIPYSENPSFEWAPAITVSNKATIEPASGVSQHFTRPGTTETPVYYDVIAGDKTIQTWAAYVLVDDPITSFVANAQPGADSGYHNQAGDSEIDGVNHYVVFHMPFEFVEIPDTASTVDVDVTPLIGTSGGSDVYLEDQFTLASGTTVTFTIDKATRTGQLTYYVDSGNLGLQQWIVYCIIDMNDENDILSFTVDGQEGDTFITHDEDSGVHTVEFCLPFTDLSSINPKVTVSEKATYEPYGTSVNFSSQYVEYIVTAQDGTAQLWYVYCYLESAMTDIMIFTVPGQVGPSDINADTNTVEFTVPYTLNPIFSPTITLSPRAITEPASGDAMDFSYPVVYTVYAEDREHYRELDSHLQYSAAEY